MMWPGWPGDRPHFRRITIRAIENTAALEANLLSGAIDYIAGELGLSLAQMALAWCLRNPVVSSVITGASKPEQVVENMIDHFVLFVPCHHSPNYPEFPDS